VRLANLQLRAAESERLRFHRLLDQGGGGQVEPATLGGVDGNLRLRPPAPSTAATRAPALGSHKAVSIAASARLVIAPTAVACVQKNRSFQIASMQSGSRPTSFGAR
jgi:hypothetical protein